MVIISNVLALFLLLMNPDSINAVIDTLSLGAEAPRFYASYLDGGDFYLSRNVGAKARLSEKKPVVLSFFTTTCIPCRQEIPLLDSLQAEFPRVAIYLVNVGEEPQIVINFVQKMRYKLPVLIDRYGQVARKYKATITPTLVGIDGDGRIVFFERGFRADEKDAIRQKILNLDDSSSSPK